MTKGARINAQPVLNGGYKEAIFPRDGRPIVSTEEYVATVWARYATASVGMTTHGYSASNRSNYDRF